MIQRFIRWTQSPLGEAIGFVFALGVFGVAIVFLYAVINPCEGCL